MATSYTPLSSLVSSSSSSSPLRSESPLPSSSTAPSKSVAVTDSDQKSSSFQSQNSKKPASPLSFPFHHTRKLSDKAKGCRVILCGRLIDGTGSPALLNQAVSVEDNRIVRVCSIADLRLPSVVPSDDSYEAIASCVAKAVWQDDRKVDVIDIRPNTLMPGWIDCHVHPFIWAEDYQVEHLRRSSAYKALKGLRAVQDLLFHGWTTMRIAGDADVAYGAVDLWKSIDEGIHPGPRLTGAAHYLSITGGGGDINFLSPEVGPACCSDGLVVDSADAMIKAIRTEKKYGSEWIKLLVTGAFMTEGDNPLTVHFSDAELDAALDEANRLGLPVMAHAHAAEGIKRAVRAGVRSIEHGSFIDDEGIQLMLEHDCFLVPTQAIDLHIIGNYNRDGPMKKYFQLYQQMSKVSKGCLSRAIKAGVKIALGTDFIGWTPDLSCSEFILMNQLGMEPLQTIHSATLRAAELLGWQDHLGSIEPGKLADFVAVKGDPVQDISNIRNVCFVMLDGAVVRFDELQ